MNRKYFRAGFLAAILLVLLAALPGVCHAGITVQDVAALPPDCGFSIEAPLTTQVIPSDAIQSEVNYLSQNKIFADKVFNVCLYDSRVYWTSQGVKVGYGGTNLDGSIYIFAGWWNADTVSSAVVHEIGHMIRHYYITDDELQTYMTMRGVKDGTLLDGVASVKEELFAEDFRTLFGDQHAQVPMYSFYQTIGQPTETDKEFILECICKHGTENGGQLPVVAAGASTGPGVS
jgi:hypothetical protein